MMRIERVCKWVKEQKLDALLIENPADLFYLTGVLCSVGRLILKPEGAFLLVDGRYYEMAKKQGPPCEIVLAGKDALSEVLQSVKKVGFDSAFFTIDRYEALKTTIPRKEWVAVSKPLKNFRAFKDTGEIAALKRAARVTWEGYQKVLKNLKEGVTEMEIALDFELYCRRNGASKLTFEPIVAFGENSAYPHYRAGQARLKKNQIVLLDLGAVVDQYRGDMTRVFFFGEPHPDLERFYRLVQSAHDAAAAAVRPGIKIGDLDRIARSILAKEEVESLFTHALGHGVGLEAHEYPSVRADGEDRDLLLRPGMVFTIEPGLYLPGVGGVRYENTFAVTEHGAENFYAGL